MSLAESDALLFARKGEAAPTPFAGRDAAAAAFGQRRRLTLVAPVAHPAPGRPRRRREARKRFTFRLSDGLHAGLTEAAARAGLSRQRYLERLLVAALDEAGGEAAS